MRKALGRGLEALLPAMPESAPTPTATRVPAGAIVPNPEQPRRHFDEEALAGLADSIARHGLLQPLVVRRAGAGWELIAGERRLRAAMRAGLEEVPVVVRDGSPRERLELALIENLQREDLSPLEEAEAYRHLIDAYGMKQEEIASQVGKSRPAIANALRLLALPDVVKAHLESGELSAGHARAVLAVEGTDAQVAFAREIVVGKVSKSAAERAASSRRPTSRSKPAGADIHLRALADDLTRSLGTRVRVVRRARGGSIEIEFYSDAELDRLANRLRGPAARH
jgi:ParB family chromosome partitioning protein